MNQAVPPEEKLLKLIRKKQKDSSSVKETEAVTQKLPSNFNKSEQKEIPKISFFKAANILLLIVMVSLSGYIIVNYFLKGNDYGAIEGINVNKSIEEKKEIVPIPLAETKPSSFYEQKIEQKDIFQLPWEQPQVNTDNTVTQQDVSLYDQIRLIGILLDKDPKAIIEDLKANQTVFMSKGEKIGEAVLEDIQADKVIFTYKNQRIELVP